MMQKDNNEFDIDSFELTQTLDKIEDSDLETQITEDEATPDEKRAKRKKRRIRNEILAYLLVTLFIVSIGSAVALGVKTFVLPQEQTQEESDVTQEDIQDKIDSMVGEEEDLTSEYVIEETAEEKFDDYLDTVISAMTLEQKVAGLFITTPEELTGVATATQAGTGTETALATYPVGGIVYYMKNIESETQFTEMLTNTNAYSTAPLFLAVTEEQSSVSSIANSAISIEDMSSVSDIAESQDTAAAYQQGLDIATYLTSYGVNMNLAPVADVVSSEDAYLDGRSYASDATVAASLVTEVVKGLEDTGVSATLKSFPGVGTATEDASENIVISDRTLEEYQASDFLVFEAGIEAGVDFIMISHVIANGITGEMDYSTFSSAIVTDILRDEMGYDGVILTSAMDTAVITEYYTSAQAAVMALKAGCDMILQPENLVEAYEAVITAVGEGVIAEERITDSLKRIYTIKYASKLEEFQNS
ncbi:MAG: glycoside hydrolase family 3 N-terminal domain-containing protein [Lachnospiraceae bacterium]